MPSRMPFMLALASCLCALAFVLGLQIFEHLDPCPLCVLQRVGLLFASVWFLVGVLHGSRTFWAKIYGLLASLGLLFGGLMALRQIWLQHLPPDQAPACSPTFFYAFEHLPFPLAWHVMFDGTGSCARITWQWLGLSLAEYSALWFLLMLGFCFLTILRNPKK